MKRMNKVRQAIDFAMEKHNGQCRKGSGLPYITHPIKVGFMLQALNLPYAVVIAGILHDTLEDTCATYEEIKDVFGVEIADLVVELTSDTKLIRRIQKALDKGNTFEQNVEEFDLELATLINEVDSNSGKNIYLIYKMVNMSKDALCAKLGDRLDNVSDLPPKAYLLNTVKLIEEVKKRRKNISLESQDLMEKINYVIQKKLKAEND